MKILVGGKDRSQELGPALSEDARIRGEDPRCLFLDWSVNALSLADARDESDYLERLTRLVRYKNHVDTRIFDIPRKPGIRGSILAAFKQFLWKLLRYQHDRVTFRQNLVNSNVMALIEFQREEIRKLEARVADLERGPRS
jgi:hypothetical protein